jgi:hypothetical protein
LLPPLPEVAGNRACPGTRTSILMPGRKGRVSSSTPGAGQIRLDAGRQGVVIDELAFGEVFDVMAGPECADGMAWFEVRSDDGMQGWLAEGDSNIYWVSPMMAGDLTTLPGFQLNLPEKVRGSLHITTEPFNPETGMPPVFIGQLNNYPWVKSTAKIFVFPLEDYLYFRPQARANLEQARSAIQTLLTTPEANVELPNIIPSYTLTKTYLPQAGRFTGGVGLHAIAMLIPGDGNPTPRIHYAYWGFSTDMRYLIFAAFGTVLALNQPPKMTFSDLQRHIALLDRDIGFSIATPVESIVVNINCPGALASQLTIGDWAMVRADLAQPVPLFAGPKNSTQLVGEMQPGENVQILEGPQCVGVSTRWRVRSLGRLEGWARENDAMETWLVKPISAWYTLPAPIQPGSQATYDLREIRLSVNSGLFSDVKEEYYPLATPMPTTATTETPWSLDPRSGIGGVGVEYSAHSIYTFSGAANGILRVIDIQNPLSHSFFQNTGQVDCLERLQNFLATPQPDGSGLSPFCGITYGGIPLHFKIDARVIPFSGGKGVRILFSSANYLTVQKLYYNFQGISDDGRFFISFLFDGISNPYMMDKDLFEMNLGPLVAWRAGQYEEAQQSYQVFNKRMKTLLEAGAVPLYPSLEILDAMMASIDVK